MPVITITMGEGQATSQQKKELIESFTENATAITGLPAKVFTILINELGDDNIGVAGKTLAQMKSDL
ncbi:MAG: tautomerase family protein [Desulfobacteraceae bacterium]|jgi:4-oxalocrotonate tautomerase